MVYSKTLNEAAIESIRSTLRTLVYITPSDDILLTAVCTVTFNPCLYPSPVVVINEHLPEQSSL